MNILYLVRESQFYYTVRLDATRFAHFKRKVISVAERIGLDMVIVENLAYYNNHIIHNIYNNITDTRIDSKTDTQ